MTSVDLSKKIIALLLAAHFLMGLGRVATLPPFEGTDETAHYARIEAAAFAPGGNPHRRISQDVFAYYRQGPMPPGWIANPTMHRQDPALKKNADPKKAYADYGAFFAKPGSVARYVRLYRETQGRASFSPGTESNWQYQHPPLYYALAAPVLRTAASRPLVTRLFILRAFTWTIGFAGLALGLLATYNHLAATGVAGGRRIAALGAFCPFLMPVFFADMGRLGNDGLCLLIFSAIWALTLGHLRRPGDKFFWPLLGFVMGCGWLTKAFMVPVSGGVLLFLAAREWRRGEVFAKNARRLLPAVAAGCVALAVGCWPYVAALGQHDFPGSLEINNWLHGRGFAPDLAHGLPWNKIGGNFAYLSLSTVYFFTDTVVSDVGLPAIAAMFAMLAMVFYDYLSALPRDIRRESWLPLWALLPLVIGLVLHAAVAGAAYGMASATPGYYVHVMEPALVLAFGTGLYLRGLQPGGGLFLGLLLAGAMLGNAALMAARLMLFSGCARFTEGYKGLMFDGACAPSAIFSRLAVLAWPGIGLPCLVLSFILLAWAVRLASAESPVRRA